MSEATAQVDRAIDEYLAGSRDFLSLWRDFMDLYVERLTAEEANTYQPAYDAVYMGGGSGLTAEDRAHGLLDDGELKKQLRAFRSRHTGGSAPA